MKQKRKKKLIELPKKMMKKPMRTECLHRIRQIRSLSGFFYQQHRLMKASSQTEN